MPMACAHTRSSWKSTRSRWALVGVLLVVGGLGAWGAWRMLTRMAVYVVASPTSLTVDPAIRFVATPVAGQVSVTHLQVGREVQAGEVLVEFDSTDHRLQIEEERQRLLALEAHRTARHQEGAALDAARHVTAQGAQATLDAARARHHDAVVVLQAAQEKAQRLGPLAPLTALLPQQTAVDTTRLAVQQLEQAQQVHAAEWRARLAQSQREAVVLDGDIAIATAHLARLAHALEIRHLRAPIAGRLGAVALVQPGAFVHEGTRLAVIGPSEAPMVTAEVAPAVARGRLRPGQPAWLRVTGVPGTPSWSLAATVMQVAAASQEERLRVVLRLAPDALTHWPLQPSVTGTMAVEVERVAPVTLVVRALSQRLWGHARAPTPPVLPGEGL